MIQLKNIAILILGVIFLLSTSGFVLYKSYCACSGEDYTSIIVKPETCETDFHQHHKHDLLNNEIVCSVGDCHECHPYITHSNSCGCEAPEPIFIKLMEKAVNDAVRFVAVQPVELKVFSSDILDQLTNDNDDNLNKRFYADPPPQDNILSRLSYPYSKLKIPSLA